MHTALERLRASRGFTLIELLVTISIIALLAVIVLSALSTARAKARDSERIRELRQVQVALEAYRVDRGTYPTTFSGTNPGGVANAWRGTCIGPAGSRGTTGASGYVANVAPTYIPVLPTDPRPAGSTTCYTYASNGQDYMIVAYGTVEVMVGAGNPVPRPVQPSEASFAFYSSGAQSW